MDGGLGKASMKAAAYQAIGENNGMKKASGAEKRKHNVWRRQRSGISVAAAREKSGESGAWRNIMARRKLRGINRKAAHGA